MLKKFFKSICYKIYNTGLVESYPRIKSDKRRYFETVAHLSETANIGVRGDIINLQKDKNKVSIGRNTVLLGELIVLEQGGYIEIGEFCYISSGVKIWSGEKIIIGNRVMISHNVNIHDQVTHPLDADERHKDFLHIVNKTPMQKVDYRAKPIIIEDDVWVGFNVTILKGVTIGKGSVIGACSLITKDIPPYAVVVSNTDQQIIKYLQ